MSSLAGGRGPSRAALSRHIMRRRVAAAAIVLFIVLLAVTAAYSLPSQKPALMPVQAAVQFSTPAPADTQRIVVAQLAGVDLLLPVRREAATAIAFHPVESADAVAFTPSGDLTDADSTQESGKQLAYHLMDGDGGDRSSSTSGLDVGAVPGAAVYSPLDGQVVAVRPYRLLGRYLDYEIDIAVTADPTVRLVVTHITDAKVHVGDQVTAGLTLIGSVRALPADVEQAISQFTSDAGDHVQLVALRVTPSLAGF